MRKIWLVTAMVITLIIPSVSSAVPILSLIEVVDKVLSSSATSGASASVTFAPDIGDRSNRFSGSATANASANVTGNSEATAQGLASWTMQFQALRPAHYYISWSFDDAVSARSSRFADASAGAEVNLNSWLNVIVNDQQDVLVDTFVGSETASLANADGGLFSLGRLPVNSYFELTGSLSTNATADSGFFSSASSSASAGASFAVFATPVSVPEPSSILMAMLGFVLIILTRMRPVKQWRWF